MKLVNIHTLIIVLGLSLIGNYPHTLRAQTMSLDECIETALDNNRDLQIAKNNLLVSQYRQEEARANRWPKINASADYKYFTNLPYQLMPLSVFNGPEGQFKEAQFGVPHNISTQVQLVVPLYNPQIQAGIKGAAIAEELGNLQLEKVEEQIIYEVTGLYYNAQILQHQLSFVDSNLVNADRLLSTMQLMKAQGVAKSTDIGKVELQQAQLKSQHIRLSSQRSQVLQALNFFMGRDLETPLDVQPDVSQPIDSDYQDHPSVELRLSQVQERMLDNELDLAKKSKRPTVSLMANYGLTGYGYLEDPDPFFKVFPLGFVGVQASIPIWNRPTRYKISQKEAELAGHLLQSAQIRAKNELELAHALSRKNTTQSDLPTAQQQVTLASSIYKQTLLQQQQGTANLTDVLLADNELRQAQTNYINTLVEYLKADLELKKTSGSIKF